MQIDFGKHKSHDKDLQELAYFMTVQRTNIAVIIGTASHRNMLQKDFREELFHFEIFIPKRGTYEIQQLKRWVPFKDPLRQREKLEPFGVGPFLALPPDEQEWYDEWRIERNRKAKERLGIFQKDGGGDQDLPGFNEFAQYYRGSRIERRTTQSPRALQVCENATNHTNRSADGNLSKISSIYAPFWLASSVLS